MKRILFVLIFFVFTINAQAQWYHKYGVTNSIDLSKEQLEFALNKAETNIRTGKILTYTGIGMGTIAMIIGAHATIGIFSTDIDKTLNEYSTGGILLLSGLGAVAIGVPLWTINANRRRSIEVALIKLNSALMIDSKEPYYFCCSPSTVGMRLKINFH